MYKTINEEQIWYTAKYDSTELQAPDFEQTYTEKKNNNGLNYQ